MGDKSLTKFVGSMYSILFHLVTDFKKSLAHPTRTCRELQAPHPLTVDPFPTSQLAMPLERESPELRTCHMSKCALNFYHTFLAQLNLCLFNA